METQMNTKSGFTERYVTFLEHFNLNPNRLAEELGDSARVKFHKYKTGAAEPNSESLRLIASKYPVSLDWLLLGIGSMLRIEPGKSGKSRSEPVAANSGGATADVAFWQNRCEQLEDRIETIETKYDALMGQYNKVVDTLMQKMALSFLESGSHTTAEGMQFNRKISQYVEAVRSAVVDGFIRYDDQEEPLVVAESPRRELSVFVRRDWKATA